MTELKYDEIENVYRIKGFKNNKKDEIQMKDISKIVADVESTLAPYFKEIEETAYINQEKY